MRRRRIVELTRVARMPLRVHNTIADYLIGDQRTKIRLVICSVRRQLTSIPTAITPAHARATVCAVVIIMVAIAARVVCRRNDARRRACGNGLGGCVV